MPDDPSSPKSQARKAREERLAAELRENLRKRKAQGRVRKAYQPVPADPHPSESGNPAFGGSDAE